MRPRSLIAALVAALVLALAGLAVSRNGPGPHHPQPPTGTAPMPRSLDLGPQDEDRFAGPLRDVMPMHQAVRRALRRFDGKVLDIALVPQRGPGSPLIYRIRILTRGSEVVDIRMDALTGRFLEVRGADLGAARFNGKDH